MPVDAPLSSAWQTDAARDAAPAAEPLPLRREQAELIERTAQSDDKRAAALPYVSPLADSTRTQRAAQAAVCYRNLASPRSPYKDAPSAIGATAATSSATDSALSVAAGTNGAQLEATALAVARPLNVVDALGLSVLVAQAQMHARTARRWRSERKPVSSRDEEDAEASRDDVQSAYPSASTPDRRRKLWSYLHKRRASARRRAR